jgi:hypothetical protein
MPQCTPIQHNNKGKKPNIAFPTTIFDPFQMMSYVLQSEFLLLCNLFLYESS